MNQLSLITTEIIAEISEEFKVKINEIFGQNLIFAFICGGIGKGYARDFTHDIDMFVCLNSRHEEQEKFFQDFYLEIHETYGLTPDHIFPGEVTTEAYLSQALDFLEQIRIRLIIETDREYEAIVWGEILAGETGLATGNKLELLSSIKARCKSYPQKWRKEILAEIATKRFSIEQIELLKEILSLFKKLEKKFLSLEEKFRLSELITHFKNDYRYDSTKYYLNSIMMNKLQNLDINLLFEIFVVYLTQANPRIDDMAMAMCP